MSQQSEMEILVSSKFGKTINEIFKNLGMKAKHITFKQRDNCVVCMCCEKYNYANFGTMVECQHSICVDCLDKLTDETDKYEYLFICPFCQTKITEINYKM